MLTDQICVCNRWSFASIVTLDCCIFQNTRIDLTLFRGITTATSLIALRWNMYLNLPVCSS